MSRLYGGKPNLYDSPQRMADGDALITDALTVTRNLHRLIITVSLVTIIFSLSLRLPQNVRLREQAIRRFLQTDFSDYDRFVDSEVEKVQKLWLAPLAHDLRETLKGLQPPPAAFSDIADAFERPIFIDRFRV